MGIQTGKFCSGGLLRYFVWLWVWVGLAATSYRYAYLPHDQSEVSTFEFLGGVAMATSTQFVNVSPHYRIDPIKLRLGQGGNIVLIS